MEGPRSGTVWIPQVNKGNIGSTTRQTRSSGLFGGKSSFKAASEGPREIRPFPDFAIFREIRPSPKPPFSSKLNYQPLILPSFVLKNSDSSIHDTKMVKYDERLLPISVLSLCPDRLGTQVYD